MPHKNYEKQKFNEEVTKLRKRFDRKESNSLFLTDSHSKNIRIERLPAFIKEIWATI